MDPIDRCPTTRCTRTPSRCALGPRRVAICRELTKLHEEVVRGGRARQMLAEELGEALPDLVVGDVRRTPVKSLQLVEVIAPALRALVAVLVAAERKDRAIDVGAHPRRVARLDAPALAGLLLRYGRDHICCPTAR